MGQSHFTLSFPLRSPADANMLAEQLPAMMPDLFEANDKIGRVHYSRFTILSERTLLFLGDFLEGITVQFDVSVVLDPIR